MRVVARRCLIVQLFVFQFLVIGTSYSFGESESRYNIFIDPTLNMRSGVEYVAFAHQLWANLENTLIPSHFFKGSSGLEKSANVGLRFLKIFVLDYPLSFWIFPILNHEIFGHGARYWETGIRITGVFLTAPPPFDYRLPTIYGSDWVAGEPYDQQRESQRKIITIVGGSEASTILARVISRNSIQSGTISYQNALVYLFSNNDINGYTLITDEARKQSDVHYYVSELNELYSTKEFSANKLHPYAWIAMATDPMNYYALYSIFAEYMLRGKTHGPVFMIPFGSKVDYLPKFRYIFTPYGTELILDNYLKVLDSVVLFQVGLSDGTIHNSWRSGITAWNIPLRANFSLDLGVQFWRQPEIKYMFNKNYYDKHNGSSNGFGGRGMVRLQYDFSVSGIVTGLVCELSYKTAGFVQSEPLQAGVVAKGGLRVRL